MSRAPLIGLLIPMVIGILLSEWLPLAAWQSAVIAALFLLIALLNRHQRSPLFHIGITASWCAIGLSLAVLHKPSPIAVDEGRYTLQAVVLSPAKATAKCHKVEAQLEYIDTLAVDNKIILYIPQRLDVVPHYGDRLTMFARVDQPYSSDDPSQFDYRRYLARRGIHHIAFAYEVHSEGPALESHILRRWGMRQRERLIGIIQSLQLTSNQKGIAEALLLGWDADLDSQTRQHYRDAGIAHLLCVSGLHVGIVAALLGWLLIGLGRGPRGRRIGGLLQLAGVWLFVLVTGCAPATTRAAIMFSFFIIGRSFLLQGNSFNTLAAAALIMLAAKPGLVYDLGFQLSFSAVLGIIGLATPFYHTIPWPDEALLEKRSDEWNWKTKAMRLIPLRTAQRIWQLLTLTTAAQLATLPLTLYYFHRFSSYFLIANMTIVPCAGLLLSTILAVLIIPALAPLLAWELHLTDRLTSWIAQLPHAVIDDIYFPLPRLIITSAIVIILITYVTKEKTR